MGNKPLGADEDPSAPFNKSPINRVGEIKLTCNIEDYEGLNWYTIREIIEHDLEYCLTKSSFNWSIDSININK